MNPEAQHRRAPKPAKVQPIAPEKHVLALPSDVDAEKFILGSILIDGCRFKEVEALTTEDWSVERHRRVFNAMVDLRLADENFDYITVADRLRQRNEGSGDDLSFLTDLTTGIPCVPHLDSWVRILRKKSQLRWMIQEADRVTKECQISSADPVQILAEHAMAIENLRIATVSDQQQQIRRIEDLESIFARRASTEYLIQPELPIKAIVCLTGDSESGKTTLACAWARDVFLQGHPVLILDRDKNPRDRVCDRLERLGLTSDAEYFRVWDCEQAIEPPQPDDPVVVDWVNRVIAQTAKPPLVVLDALINFFLPDEDENSAVDMRAIFNRCRVLTKLGATVILIHHTNRNGEARGSSDFRPASDQAFRVSNCDRGGGRLLDVITLQCEKSRYGLSGRISYEYADGKMGRVAEQLRGKEETQRLVALLEARPGILTEDFVKAAGEIGVKRERARAFLKEGESDGTIRVQKDGRKRLHFMASPL